MRIQHIDCNLWLTGNVDFPAKIFEFLAKATSKDSTWGHEFIRYCPEESQIHIKSLQFSKMTTKNG